MSKRKEVIIQNIPEYNLTREKFKKIIEQNPELKGIKFDIPTKRIFELPETNIQIKPSYYTSTDKFQDSVIAKYQANNQLMFRYWNDVILLDTETGKPNSPYYILYMRNPDQKRSKFARCQ